MIQLTRTDRQFEISTEEMEALRQQFRAEDFVRLPALLEPVLMKTLCPQLADAPFEERMHPAIGPNKELCLRRDHPIYGLLNFLMNSPPFFRTIEQITGCGAIGNFIGRVYRFMPNRGHQDSWHSDMADHRLVALSLNLGTEPYSGGVLELRERASGAILRRVVNTGFGDAILFRLDERLEHRVTEVDGAVAKTAFAGWFRSQPAIRDLLPTPNSRASGIGDHADG